MVLIFSSYFGTLRFAVKTSIILDYLLTSHYGRIISKSGSDEI